MIQTKKKLQRLGVSKEHTDIVLRCVKQLKYTFAAQKATMRHFEDHSAKIGLLPSDMNKNVNLTLVWWGNPKGNAV